MTDQRYRELMERIGMPNSRSLLNILRTVANEVAQEVIATEREACAVECENIEKELVSPKECATILRARLW